MEQPIFEELSAKDELLNSLESTKAEKLSFNFLLKCLMWMMLFLMLLAPKIFLSNTIYYMSLEISALSSDYRSLKEENIFLKQKVESMHYKNEVIDRM